jgi:uncharacterized integral membrane protein
MPDAPPEEDQPTGSGSVALNPPGPPAEATDGATHSSPTRVSASWTAVVIGLVILILLIIFVAENTQSAQVNYFGVHGKAPTAVVLLIAAVAGAVIVVTVAASRILQLRKRAKRAEQAAP